MFCTSGVDFVAFIYRFINGLVLVIFVAFDVAIACEQMATVRSGSVVHKTVPVPAGSNSPPPLLRSSRHGQILP